MKKKRMISRTAAAVLLAACLLLIERPAGRRNWRAVAMFPLFMASWLPLQLLAMFHRTTVWREIPHTGGKNHDFA